MAPCPTFVCTLAPFHKETSPIGWRGVSVYIGRGGPGISLYLKILGSSSLYESTTPALDELQSRSVEHL